jgi:ketosteroid isomerase-like protein
MSQENVEIVRAIYEAWSKRESPRALLDPDIEYVNPAYAVESGVRRGPDALNRIRDVYPDFRVELERFVDAGEHVVVIGVARGTSASGVETKRRQGFVWTVRGGRAVTFRWFNEPSEALKAVGLEE